MGTFFRRFFNSNSSDPEKATIVLHPDKIRYAKRSYGFDEFAGTAATLPISRVLVTTKDMQLPTDQELENASAKWTKVFSSIKSNIHWIFIARTNAHIPATLLNSLFNIQKPYTVDTLSFSGYDGVKSGWILSPCEKYEKLKIISFADSNSVGMSFEQECECLEMFSISRSLGHVSANPGEPKLIQTVLDNINGLRKITTLTVLRQDKSTLPEVVAEAEKLSEGLLNLQTLETSITTETFDGADVIEALEHEWLNNVRFIQFEFQDEPKSWHIREAKEKLCINGRRPAHRENDGINFIVCEKK